MIISLRTHKIFLVKDIFKIKIFFETSGAAWKDPERKTCLGLLFKIKCYRAEMCQNGPLFGNWRGSTLKSEAVKRAKMSVRKKTC